MLEAKMYIDGQWVEARSGQRLTTVNPSTGEALGTVPSGAPEDVDVAVRAARRSFGAWSSQPQGARSDALCKVADALRARAGELAELETLEHGTPQADAMGMVMGAAAKFEWSAHAAHRIMGTQIPVEGSTLSYLQRHPSGVAGFIIPWNLPTIMAAVKLAPALAVGNTCVLKPASINSLIGLKLAEIIHDAGVLPPGAVNFVTGPGGSVGGAIATHEEVDIVGFTGSSETGKSLLVAAAATVKKCVMELGGNNPVLLYPDADVDAALDVLAYRQYNNSGQHCSGPGRYYIHERIYDEFTEKMRQRAEAVVMGDPRDATVNMGPVVSAEHQRHVLAHIEDAVAEGARIVTGGQAQRPGFFVQPTVVADVRHEMRIAREEVFGPVAVLIKYTDADDLVTMANGSRYGLCAHVWTRDLAKGMGLIEKLQAGAFFLNTQMLTDEQSWGTSVKESGIGKEGGNTGMLEFTDQKLVCIKYA
ncbi:MAG: aldehyde dehydrogenase family protein [Clostridiales Family XIII bacterium]|jgi:acyl-CoA reductase-like NAD-dependent aldehyde dehydrogenase|nr:aldehyde dehydrogenase family protein [Clostridiales Family XIII bacterium]